MARFDKKRITIPEGIEVFVGDGKIRVKGPKGENSFPLASKVEVLEHDKTLAFTTKYKEHVSKVGLSYRLLLGLIKGVQEGYSKTLELRGVGYRWSVKDDTVAMQLGFSHPVACSIPQGVKVKIEKNLLTLEGVDKQEIGETAARIRRQRKLEPYKGKGIRYLGETIVLKAGKAGKK